MSKRDRIYRTSKGYFWMCKNRECLEERDDWGEDDSPTEFYHCANPEGCHGVLWLEKDGVECEICKRYYCQSCTGGVSGRFTDSDSDLTKRQLKEYDEDNFLCYECVPKNEVLI